MIRLALCIEMTDAQKTRLQAGIGNCELFPATDIAACEIAFGNPDPDLLADAARLRWLQLESVGFGEYLRLDWQKLGVKLKVTNLAGMFADPAAKTALAGILALGRAIDRLTLLQNAGTWVGDAIRTEMFLLKGRNVVLFGRGAINGRVAELLAPFHCQVTSFGRDWSPEALDDALSEADIVIGCVPDTPSTRGLFGADRFAAMKPGAIFCNIGRGSLVDEATLVDELGCGHLGGAVIDVTVQEPLPQDHPFWTMPNTILTQHSGGGTADEMDRKIDWFLENLQRYRNDQPLRAVVNFDKGY